MTAASPNSALTSTHCAVCGRPLTDAISIEVAVDPDCRSQYGYVHISKLTTAQHQEANAILHALAADVFFGAELRGAIFRLHDLGFVELAKRIERRVHSRLVVVQQEPAALAPGPIVPAKIELPFTLTQGQEQACAAVQRMMATRGFGMCVVAGFAGVGKTTVLRVFGQQYGTPTVITPTGKAALRVREATGLNASTIHRWIYAPAEDPHTGVMKFVRRKAEDIAVTASRLVLLDEASMVGPEVWRDVLSVCKMLELKLVLIGDAFQLPPVQAPNAPAFSLLDPKFAAEHGVERVELTEVLRQALDSPIIRASMALRQGQGLSALRELKHIEMNQLASVTTAVHAQGGVTICHRNATRFQLNAGIRGTLGIYDEQPQVGEPLMVLKNSYEAGVVNGETIQFGGWEIAPDVSERVHDRFKNTDEAARFGATRVSGNVQVVMALEEIHGRLQAGTRAIENVAFKWARLNNLIAGETLAPHVHVNFGYAYTAHKCVHPRTLVETPQGLLRMEELAARGEIGTPLGPMPYRGRVRNTTGRMLSVTTHDGYELNVTPDHGLWAWTGEEYTRVLAEQLRPGQFVRLRLGSTCDTRRTERLPPPPACDVRAVAHTIPTTVTSDLAELLGLIVADGVVAPRVVRLLKQHRDVVVRFAELFERVFGCAVAVKRDKHSRAWMAEFHSTLISSWLRSLGGTAPHQKDVPVCILRAPLHLQADFLRGLFEDGGVNMRGTVPDHIEWSNKTHDVVGTVQTMLLRFEIASSRRRRKTSLGKWITSLYVYGHNIKRFRGAIGFIAATKTARLVRAGRGRETRFVAPWARKVVWIHLTQIERNNFRRDGTLSRDRTQLLRARTKDAALIAAIDETLGWHHTRVKSVRRTADAESMCVTVPGVGRFLQNGFDGSNSQGSEWPYVLVVLEQSIRLNEEEGRRWGYTAITRASKMCAVLIAKT